MSLAQVIGLTHSAGKVLQLDDSKPFRPGASTVSPSSNGLLLSLVLGLPLGFHESGPGNRDILPASTPLERMQQIHCRCDPYFAAQPTENSRGLCLN
jgi:hypothetical protein